MNFLSLTKREQTALQQCGAATDAGNPYRFALATMEGLRAKGLVETYVPIGRRYKHLPYRITDAGRAALSKQRSCGPHNPQENKQ